MITVTLTDNSKRTVSQSIIDRLKANPGTVILGMKYDGNGQFLPAPIPQFTFENGQLIPVEPIPSKENEDTSKVDKVLDPPMQTTKPVTPIDTIVQPSPEIGSPEPTPIVPTETVPAPQTAGMSNYLRYGLYAAAAYAAITFFKKR